MTGALQKKKKKKVARKRNVVLVVYGKWALQGAQPHSVPDLRNVCDT